jgi:hypothetical protein
LKRISQKILESKKYIHASLAKENIMATDPSIQRNEYIRELREIEAQLSSVETIGFIQTQSPGNRSKFFDLKSEIAIRRSKLEIARLDTIALRLQQLEGDFKQGITNIGSAIDSLSNITEVLSTIDLLVGVLSRIFV